LFINLAQAACEQHKLHATLGETDLPSTPKHMQREGEILSAATAVGCANALCLDGPFVFAPAARNNAPSRPIAQTAITLFIYLPSVS
jgi:hypothetical protein